MGCVWVAYLLAAILADGAGTGVLRVGGRFSPTQVFVQSVDPNAFAVHFAFGLGFCVTFAVLGLFFLAIAVARFIAPRERKEP
jgi:hypothetical protein